MSHSSEQTQESIRCSWALIKPIAVFGKLTVHILPWVSFEVVVSMTNQLWHPASSFLCLLFSTAATNCYPGAHQFHVFLIWICKLHFMKHPRRTENKCGWPTFKPENQLGRWLSKYLTCKRENLRSGPQKQRKKPDIVVRVYNPSTGEAETGGSPNAHWPVSLAELISEGVGQKSLS